MTLTEALGFMAAWFIASIPAAVVMGHPLRWASGGSDAE